MVSDYALTSTGCCGTDPVVARLNLVALIGGHVASEKDMAATVFAMVPAEVTDAGNYVRQVAESLINGLDSLDREVTGVLDHWTGSAAQAFGEGWTETKNGAAGVLNALRTMGELLDDASKAIVGQDISDSDTLSSLDLPGLNL